MSFGKYDVGKSAEGELFITLLENHLILIKSICFYLWILIVQLNLQHWNIPKHNIVWNGGIINYFEKNAQFNTTKHSHMPLNSQSSIV